MNAIKYFAYIVLFLGLCALIWLCFFFPEHGIVQVGEGETPNMDEITGPIGDFVGGIFGTIFSFVSALLVVFTLELQSKQYAQDRFEQSFFEMLHIHNDNVKGMKLVSKNNVIAEGREVFKHIVEHYNKTYNIIDEYCFSIINGSAHELSNSQQMIKYLSDDKKRNSLVMQIAYGYSFFGSENYCLKRVEEPIVRDIENYIRKMMDSNGMFVSAKNVLLGHYYRHLYQMVTFIAKSKCLSEKEKYEYAKQVRAQLDDEEQLLLYYNAMSDIGSEWRIKGRSSCIIYRVKDMCLITRFRLIKNIPSLNQIKGLKPHEVFAEDIKILKKKELDFFENES